MRRASLSGSMRGIGFMVLAMASFVTNDTFLKLAMETLAPYQALFLRSAAVMVFGLPLIFLTGAGRHIGQLFAPRVLMRNVWELIAVVGFILGLAHVSLAEITALSLLSPFFVLGGAALFFGTRVRLIEGVLAGAGFAGALMVAQPGSAAFSLFSLFGLWNAVATAARELFGRRVAGHVPGLVVAVGAGLLVLFGAGLATLFFEHWHAVGRREAGFLLLSGIFLTGGHFFVFSAFRAAEPPVIAPFFYVSVIFALLSSGLVFGAVPNGLALAGIGVILVTGVVLTMISGRPEVPPAS